MRKPKCEKCGRPFDPTNPKATEAMGPTCAAHSASSKKSGQGEVALAEFGNSKSNIKMSSFKESPYFSVASKMVRCLPHVFADGAFALKGGTAINLLYQDLPRLSVDIDLMIPAVTSREDAIALIESGVVKIQESIRAVIPSAKFITRTSCEGVVTGLYIEIDGDRVELDINSVIRGSVYPIEQKRMTKNAEDLFQAQIEVPTLSEADLYGGKICAALDRQHPRDLFDVQLMFDSSGLTPEIRTAAIAYMLCSGRPTHEFFNPTRKNQKDLYERTFAGMTDRKFDYDDFESTRERLIKEFQSSLTQNEKEFLLSVNECNPKWDLMPDTVPKLPAIQWKIQNLEKLKKQNKKKFDSQFSDLKTRLGF